MNRPIALAVLQEIYPVELFVLAVVFLAVLSLLYRLGFSTNLGLLTAGVAAGSLELNFLMHEEIMHGLAELGALLLLLVTSARCRYRLVESGASGMKFTAVYVVLATVFTASLLRLLGLSWQESIFSALLLAFTCTPVTIKLLSSSPTISRGVGLFNRMVLIQVLIVLVVLPLIPLMGGHPIGAKDVLQMYLAGLPLIAIAFILADRWFPETVSRIQREHTEETAFIMVGTILALPLLLTYLVGLPLAFGAVTSGVLVSETPLRGRPIGEVISLRWMMAALFLVPLGILFDYQILLKEVTVIGAMLTGMVVLKVVFLAAAAVIIHHNWRKGFRFNVHLLPIGALSFLIFAEGRSYGLTPGGWETGGEQLFIAVIVLLFVGYALATTITVVCASGGAAADEDRSPEGMPVRANRSMGDSLHVGTRNGRYATPDEGNLVGLRLFDGKNWLVPVQATALQIFLWTVPVEENAPIVGYTVEDLRRHPRFNLILLSVWRSDICYADPPRTLRLVVGDRLLVSGTRGEYEDGGKLFSSPEGSDADDIGFPFDS